MHAKTINPVTRAYRRYFLEFAASMVAYVAVVWVRNLLLHGPMRHTQTGWQIAIALMPVIPAIFLFAAIVRYVRGMDELGRRICVDSLAIAGGATAMAAVTYGFIEGEFFPYVSAWWTYGTFMIAWLVASLFVRLRYR